MLTAIFEKLEITETIFDKDYCDSFLALGLAWFISDLLTRKLRYMSDIDMTELEKFALSSIESYKKGDKEEANDELQKAFDLVCEANEYYFPTPVKFLDFTRAREEEIEGNSEIRPEKVKVVSDQKSSETACQTSSDNITSPAEFSKAQSSGVVSSDIVSSCVDATDSSIAVSSDAVISNGDSSNGDSSKSDSSNSDNFRQSLRKMLLRRRDRLEKTNLLLSLSQLEKIALEDPDLLSLLREESESGRINFLAGDAREDPLYLMPQYEVLKRLVETRERYRELVGNAPNVFSRNTAGLTPVLPQLLHLAGWKSGSLFTTDGWHLDLQLQSRIQWKGADGTILPCLGQEPLDGEKDEIFMEQLDKLGYSYSNDEVMTAVFAHRPNRECAWFGEVERFNRFDPIFGKIMGIDEYFDATRESGSERTLPVDDFRTNYLTRNEKNNPVSYWRDFHKNFVIVSEELFADLMDLAARNNKREYEKEIRSGNIVGATADENDPNDENDPKAVSKVSAKSPSSNLSNNSSRILLNNPTLTVKSLVLEGHPETEEPEILKYLQTFISEETGLEKTVITLPPLSRFQLKMVNSPDSSRKSGAKTKKGGFFKRLLAPLVKSDLEEEEDPNTMAGLREDRISRMEVHRFYFLRNEFFELQIDPATGQLRRLQTWETGSMEVRRGLLRQPGRGNRFASHLAYRMSSEELEKDSRNKNDGNYGYSIMAADKIKILENGPVQGKIAIYGTLKLPDGQIVADFEQYYTVRRARKIIDVKAVIKPKINPEGPVWKNYFATRFAWRDKFADIKIGNQERFWETSRDYYQAPYGIDIRSGDDLGITILSKGHPFYYRRGNRIDAVLIPKNENETIFEFGIGVDLEQSAVSAFNFLGPDPVPENCPNNLGAEPSFTQLFKVDARSVVPVALEELKRNNKKSIVPVEKNSDERYLREIKTGENGLGEKVSAVMVSDESQVREILLILQETQGRKEKISLTVNFPFEKAEVLSCLDQGEKEADVTVLSPDQEGVFSLDIGRYKLVPIRFSLK